MHCRFPRSRIVVSKFLPRCVKLPRERGQEQDQAGAAAGDRFNKDVNGLVQRMTRSGLIRCEPDSSDRRVQRIFLTERGRVLMIIFGHDGEQWQTLKKAPD